MSVECSTGFSPDPEARLPSKPADSTTLQANNTYVRLRYEWERADNTAPASCGCGQQCTFNMTYGVTSEGNVVVAPFGLGGGVGGGEVTTNELSVDVGSREYEYVGIKVILKETREMGTYTNSGGFQKGGLWSKIKFAWNFIRHGPAAIIPTLTYNAPDKTETRFIQAAWKICKNLVRMFQV